MKSYQRSQRVNASVQQGLARCRYSDTPLYALSQFIDELRADETWREVDLAIVESAIRHIVAQVTQPSP